MQVKGTDGCGGGNASQKTGLAKLVENRRKLIERYNNREQEVMQIIQQNADINEAIHKMQQIADIEQALCYKLVIKPPMLEGETYNDPYSLVSQRDIQNDLEAVQEAISPLIERPLPYYDYQQADNHSETVNNQPNPNVSYEDQIN